MTETETAAHSLCKACGFCCDGTLFSCTRISHDHDKEALESGVFGSSQDQKALPQPCPALDGGLCVLYEIRPRVCRKYKCNPLKKFLNDTASYEETSFLITKFRHQVDEGRKRFLSTRNDKSATQSTKELTKFEYVALLYFINKTFKGNVDIGVILNFIEPSIRTYGE